MERINYERLFFYLQIPFIQFYQKHFAEGVFPWEPHQYRLIKGIYVNYKKFNKSVSSLCT